LDWRLGQDQFNRGPGFPSLVAGDTEAAQHDLEQAHALYALRAYDTSGNVSGDSCSAEIVMPEEAGVVSEATISPDNGATLISVDNKVTAVFSAGLSEFAMLAGEPYHLCLPPIMRAELCSG
jgi:hypothetical protein